jgi:Holliday junction resolvasome RuvABC endonuclease subunit
MMRVKALVTVGIDTGPKSHAWGAVRRERDGLVYVAHGSITVGLDQPYQHGLLELLARMPRVAIECPQHAYSAATASPIIATARAAGELAGRLAVLGLQPVYITAADWRRELLGVANAHDAAVKAWLKQHVTGMPTRSNAHVRDALGLACHMAMRAERGTP